MREPMGLPAAVRARLEAMCDLDVRDALRALDATTQALGGAEAAHAELVRERDAARAALQAAHVERPYVHPSGYPASGCGYCGMRWPCDTSRLLATVTALEAERDAARAHAADAMAAHGLAVESLRHGEALQKRELRELATQHQQWAAVVRAARAWADGEAGTAAWLAACEALDAAVAALPEEG